VSRSGEGGCHALGRGSASALGPLERTNVFSNLDGASESLFFFFKPLLFVKEQMCSLNLDSVSESLFFRIFCKKKGRFHGH
jgi:hypothetical protein